MNRTTISNLLAALTLTVTAVAAHAQAVPTLGEVMCDPLVKSCGSHNGPAALVSPTAASKPVPTTPTAPAPKPAPQPTPKPVEPKHCETKQGEHHGKDK